jgi:hypothetical protein
MAPDHSRSPPGEQDNRNEPRMITCCDRTAIIDTNGDSHTFEEGPQTDEARQRYEHIQDELGDGYLDQQIRDIATTGTQLNTELDGHYKALIDDIVDGVSDRGGRSLAGLAVVQLTIKSIEPDQNIRLHKGSQRPDHFGWKEGVSFRTIDSNHIAPALREYDLLRVNKDGVMMTRSLAENYPYSQVYKASLRGPRDAWGKLVEAIERSDSTLAPEPALRYLLLTLVNRGSYAQEINQDLLDAVEDLRNTGTSTEQVFDVIQRHIRQSPHSDRVLKIALHTLYQVLDENDQLSGVSHTGGKLQPVEFTPLPDANIDSHQPSVTVTHPSDDSHIHTAWDVNTGRLDMAAKLDQLENLLDAHPEIQRLGVIVENGPNVDPSIDDRLTAIEDEHNVEIRITTFEDLCTEWLEDLLSAGVDYSQWLVAYAETLTHRRRDRAPLSEPTREWVEILTALIEDEL